MMRKLLLLSVAVVALAGCVSAPPTDPQVSQLPAETLGLQSQPSAGVAAQWWKSFGDPQLDRLVAEAQADNPSLAMALARLREAQAQLSSTRAATDPQLTGDAQATRQRLSGNYIIPPPYAGTWRWMGSASADLSWSLDLFGREQALVDRAQAVSQAAALDAEAAKLVLAGTVASTYVQLARAYALADAAEAAVRQRESVHHLIAQRLKSGLDSPATVKQASAQLAMAREEWLRAKAECDIAVHLLAALTGKGAQGYDLARPQLREAALTPPAILPSDLLARRADIAAAKARIAAATAGRTAAHQAFYPDINLLGTAGWTSIGLAPLLTASSLQYGGGAAIHLPIFDAGKLRADYAGATAKLDEAVADYNQSLLTAIRQTADAITQMKTADAQAAQQGQALQDASDAYELTASRYKNGLASELSLLSAEETLIQARRQSAVITAERAASRIALVMALGGGFAAVPQNAIHPSNGSNQGETHE